MNVVLFGPPGVGKGTQGVRLAADYDLLQVATGDLLRSEVKAGSVLGIKAKSFMDAGGLVPDDVVVGMIELRLVKENSGILLDGFPRNVVQAEALTTMLASHDQQLDRIVFMDASHDQLIQRLCGRRICRDCGRSFHVAFNPTEVDSVCDNCGGDLYQRDDDRKEVIENRLQVYRAQTEPLIAFYQDQPGFHRVDGSGALDAVYSALQQAMDSE